jgi:hypothetical protein
VDFDEFHRVLDNLRVGETAQLRIARPIGQQVWSNLKPGETAYQHLARPEVASNLDVTLTGEEPTIAMIYYQSYWHPIAGGLGLVLGLWVLATPKPPRWRGPVLAIFGFSMAVGFFIILVQPWHDIPVFRVRQYHTLYWGERLHFNQTWVGLTAALALAVLGVLEYGKADAANKKLSRAEKTA